MKTTKQKNNRGLIPIWVIGILTTVTLGYSSLTTATLFRHSETNSTQDSRLSVNETNIENMKEIMMDIKKGNDQIIKILMNK